MPHSPPFPRVKVMGERGSGTNFLAQLVGLNFRVEFVRNTSPAAPHEAALIEAIPRGKRRPALMADRVLEHNHLSEMDWNAGWKHACLTDRVFKTYKNANETVFLCILRHPAPWLRSFFEKPFHSFNNRPDDIDELIATPWMTRSCDEIDSLVLESPVLLWRHKAQSYLEQANRRQNVVVLRHEDILGDFKSVLDALSDILSPKMRLGWKLPKGYARGWMRNDRAGVDFHTIREALPADPFTLLTPGQADRVRALIGKDLLARAGYGGQA